MAGVRLVVNLHSKPGEADKYAQAWSPHYEEVNSEAKGCLQYELFRSTDNPDNFAVLEWWVDKSAFQAHWEIERRRGAPGLEFLGRGRDRLVGQDGAEIYWEQQNYRFDSDSDVWVPR